MSTTSKEMAWHPFPVIHILSLFFIFSFAYGCSSLHKKRIRGRDFFVLNRAIVGCLNYPSGWESVVSRNACTRTGLSVFFHFKTIVHIDDGIKPRQKPTFQSKERILASGLQCSSRDTNSLILLK
jgi:hypothetical protein